MRKHIAAVPILVAIVLSAFVFVATANAGSEGPSVPPGTCDTITAGGESATVCAPTSWTRYGKSYAVTDYVVVTAGGSYRAPYLVEARAGDRICYNYVVSWGSGRFTFERGSTCVPAN